MTGVTVKYKFPALVFRRHAVCQADIFNHRQVSPRDPPMRSTADHHRLHSSSSRSPGNESGNLNVTCRCSYSGSQELLGHNPKVGTEWLLNQWCDPYLKQIKMKLVATSHCVTLPESVIQNMEGWGRRAINCQAGWQRKALSQKTKTNNKQKALSPIAGV